MIVMDTAFQATDLARNHREVIDGARRGGALIRDKDGFVLLLQPAGPANRRTQVMEWMTSAIRLDLALRTPAPARGPWSYGDFGWVAQLEEGDQQKFVDGLLERLLTTDSNDANSLDGVEDYLVDWRATAHAWGDEELRNALTTDLPDPSSQAAL